MSSDHTSSWLARRSFFSRLGAGVLALGAASTGEAAPQTTPSAAAFVPQRHTIDDWLDQTPGKHRLFLDTTTMHGVAMAVLYANNFFAANRSGYNLTDADCVVVIGVRHESTPFAFTDAMWAKHGAAFAEHASFSDPSTKQAPTLNVLQSADYKTLPNRGITIDSVIKRGLRLSVCQLATRAIAGAAARTSGASVDDVYKELTSNLIANAHIVPAGIVAVNRAQERGFTFGYSA